MIINETVFHWFMDMSQSLDIGKSSVRWSNVTEEQMGGRNWWCSLLEDCFSRIQRALGSDPSTHKAGHGGAWLPPQCVEGGNHKSKVI